MRAGYSWSFPAGDEVRVGVGSFDPRAHVKEPTVGWPATAAYRGGFQGNWIPHKLRAAVEDDVFFAGDTPATASPRPPRGSAGAVLRPLCGRELRAVLDGARRGAALARYAAEREDRRWHGAGCSRPSA